MPKSAVVGPASRRRARPRLDELTETLEGQIAEICRDLALQTKRIRQLHDQAEDLRRSLRQWARHQE